MFTRFDLTFLVAEPTRKSVQVFRQWTDYAASYNVPVAVIGNKVETGDDLLFLREHAGQHLIAHFGHLPEIRAMEQGRPFSLNDLGNDSLRTLAELRAAIDSRPKDWATFTRQATEFHLKNARAWANAATGLDLAAQIDPGFAISPSSLPASRT
jgi:CO dehydrogenase maturation factor